MRTPIPLSDLTLVDVLRDRAKSTPDREALVFLDNGADPVTDAELDLDARSLASELLSRASPGERALILLPPGRAYVAAFLGCLYAGLVAVPQYPPTARRGGSAVLATAIDAQVAVAVGDADVVRTVASEYPGLAAVPRTWVIAEDVPKAPRSDESWPAPGTDSLALLQYTSGSTGAPKGVMVRHRHLIHGSAVIARAIQAHPGSLGVSWLPPYHDMGLIGGVLQPLYSGFTCMLMAPISFLRNPFRWLEAISRYRATLTAAPDFGYLECARRISPDQVDALDLSCLEHAMIGAEPVRPSTLETFSSVFAACGFRRSAFHPCYGLAEATLFVTGGRAGADRPRVVRLDRTALQSGTAVPAADPRSAVDVTSCGDTVSQDSVLVVDRESLRPCAAGQVGEILVSGPTVAAGYWRQADPAGEVFSAAVPGSAGDFLRTGDLGFQLDGELFVTGRVKDLIIVGGRNYYPPDLEATGERAHRLIAPSRSAAFSADVDGAERVVLVHEVARGFRADEATAAVIEAVTSAITTEHGIAPHEVVLVRPGKVPVTTSGKVRRSRCRELWLRGELPGLSPGTRPAPRSPAIAPAVAEILGQALNTDPGALAPDVPLVSLGLDSLRATRLAGSLLGRFGAAPDLTELLGDLTAHGLSEWAGTARGRPGLAVPRGTGSDAVQPAEQPASSAQEWLWLLDRMGAGPAYVIACGVHLHGTVDVDRLRRAVTTVLTSHPVLATTFRLDDEGTLLATPHPGQPMPLPVTEPRRDAIAVISELASQGFDLAAGPLVRAVLVRSGDRDLTLGIVAHHIAVDGWSLAILLAELGRAYHDPAWVAPAGTEPAGTVPAGTVPALRDAEFWSATLRGARAAALPLDRPLAGRRSWRGVSAPLSLPASLVGLIKGYAAEHRATPFMVLLTALTSVLTHRTGQTDLVIGTPAAGRDAANIGKVGLFVNTLPIRVDACGDPAFAELLERVRGACLAAYAHQDLPFEKILSSADIGDPPGPRAPLVRVCLAVQDLPFEPWPTDDLSAEPFELPPPGAQFELAVNLAERPDGSMSGYTLHAADLFAETTVAAIRHELVAVLDAVTGGDERPLGPLPAGAGSLTDPQDAPPPFELVSLSSSGPPAFAEARDPVEAQLAAIWCEVIELPEISVDAEFFELGGHSLQAARIVARIETTFGVRVCVEELLTADATIEKLAAVVRDAIERPVDLDIEGAIAELAQLSDEEIADLLGSDGA